MKLKLFESHSKRSLIFYLDSVSYSYLPSTENGTNKLREWNRYLALNTDYDLKHIRFYPITNEFRRGVLELVSEMFPDCEIKDYVKRVTPDYAATVHYKLTGTGFEQLQIYVKSESGRQFTFYINKGYFIFCTSYFDIWNSREKHWESPPNVQQWSAWATFDLDGVREILNEINKIFNIYK